MDCFPKLVDPAESFLCCLPLGAGVKLLMWPHLILVLYTVATAVENLIGQDNGAPGASQMFETIWSLFGVPILFAGLWGAYHRAEPHVRFYWYYLVASFMIDVAHGGQAFACGVARSISTTAAVVDVCAQDAIISGATIFYGSVSNAVIGEAKAVGGLSIASPRARRAGQLLPVIRYELQPLRVTRWGCSTGAAALKVTQFAVTSLDDIETYAIGA
eukprot:Skav202757  [mRNA]  locus=scaffold326:62466:66638:+ [translate_table: standard]